MLLIDVAVPIGLYVACGLLVLALFALIIGAVVTVIIFAVRIARRGKAQNNAPEKEPAPAGQPEHEEKPEA